jgi:benzoate/toluate 1,2-dioxygenase beta subunit
MTNVPTVEHLTVLAANFIHFETTLLDERKFEEWSDLFDEAGTYWAPTAYDQASPLTQVSIFYDDKQMMAQRINRLRHERIHVQSPYSRTMHMLNNIRVSSGISEEGYFSAHSNFLMVEYQPAVPEGMQRMFAGFYQHELRLEAGAGELLRIRRKKATLLNCDSTFSPLALYF